MITVILCSLIVASGLIGGYHNQIVTWFQGGVPQVYVNPSLRGQRRHSIEYVAEHGGNVIRPQANQRVIYWRIGNLRATIRDI